MKQVFNLFISHSHQELWNLQAVGSHWLFRRRDRQGNARFSKDHGTKESFTDNLMVTANLNKNLGLPVNLDGPVDHTAVY